MSKPEPKTRDPRPHEIWVDDAEEFDNASERDAESWESVGAEVEIISVDCGLVTCKLLDDGEEAYTGDELEIDLNEFRRFMKPVTTL